MIYLIYMKLQLFFCLHYFCEAVREAFSTIYLREPTKEDLEHIETRFAELGFPACTGFLDCAVWDWENCPKALQGDMIGKDGKHTSRLEVICDLNLWIWGCQFGLLGVMNNYSGTLA